MEKKKADFKAGKSLTVSTAAAVCFCVHRCTYVSLKVSLITLC